MKKYLLLILLILTIFPLSVFASSEVKVDNFYYNVTVLKNGDLQVEEYFYASGKFNGYERKIDFENSSTYDFVPTMSSYGGSKIHNGNGIELVKILAVEKDKNFDFKNIQGQKIKQVNSASIGDSYKYTLNKRSSGEDYKIYLPSSKNKAFYLKYILKNMAVSHEDIAELGWNIFNNGFIDDIDNLVVYVNFPNNKNELRIWGHGPLSGQTQIVNKQQVKLEIKNLYKNTPIDIRATFDNGVIPNSSKKTSVNALQKILNYEEDMARQANYEREQSDYQNIEIIDNYFYEHDEASFRRSNYDYILNHINLLNSNEKRFNYYSKLLKYKDIVDKNEEEQLKKYIDIENPSYDEYELARNCYESIFDENLKKSYSSEIKKMKKQVIEGEKIINFINYIITIIGLLISIFITYKVYNKKIKEKQANFNELYYRDFPSNMLPSEVHYLVNRKITNDAVSATILDLIRKKYILYEIDHKHKNQYNLTKNTEDIALSPIEEKVIKMLFKTKQTINSNKITSSPTNYKKTITLIKDNVEKENLIEKRKYDSEKSENAITILVLLSIFFPPFIPIALIIYSILSKLYGNTLNVLITCFLLFTQLVVLVSNHYITSSIWLSIITVIFIIGEIIFLIVKNKPKRTDNGIEEAAKWSALKRFMKDFSNMPEKELPEIELWDKYLVYATALGIGDKVAKSLSVYIKDDNPYYNDLYLFTSYNNFHSLSNFAQSTATKTSTSSSSSSGYGGGGGFSGGGGSFGGGSGGGHF